MSSKMDQFLIGANVLVCVRACLFVDMYTRTLGKTTSSDVTCWHHMRIYINILHEPSSYHICT